MIRPFRNCKIYDLNVIFEKASKISDFETIMLLLEEVKNRKFNYKYNKLKLKIKSILIN
jgi:predicted HTH domain antitoxin